MKDLYYALIPLSSFVYLSLLCTSCFIFYDHGSSKITLFVLKFKRRSVIVLPFNFFPVSTDLSVSPFSIMHLQLIYAIVLPF